MRTTPSLLALSLAAIALPLAAHADPNAALRKTIQRNYNIMNTALAHRDFDTLASYYDPDFVTIDKSGDYNPSGREELRDLYKQMADAEGYGLKGSLSGHDNVLSLKVVAGGVVVIDKGEFTARLVAQNGNVFQFRSAGRSRDYWAKKESQYILTQSRILDYHTSTTMNGQPVQSPQPL
ncbi:hypothetical protein CCAX7_19060 [Capsulimonas corticalis]|uniref:Uncharacterized protein n=1 Tax=Capsulimonas corticalis TaxID=2219043 RepID=A0A402D5G9_9BACT|nr:nuclear transport factor 2 family protein [Capsulimonas corticalis]BDI29855.1 hypothetical protein CCAX7_19060 [Capsulimonas corticalis]